jgi:uncharacterized protein with PQ loop repeat
MVFLIMTQTESIFGLVVGILLIIGSIVSFIPQYMKIIQNKSVNGLSHWTQGLGNISAFCALFGAFMLDYEVFKYCENDKYCGRNLIPFIQLFFTWLCPLITYIIFIKYYYSNDYVIIIKKKVKQKYIVYGFFAFYVIVFLLCTTLTSVILWLKWESWKKHGILFGQILNIMSAVITSFVWIPQIIKTFKKQSIGSLSLLSLLIQAPGSFIIFIFQVIISNSSWYIGLPYMFTGIFQTVLLTMGYLFERRYRANQNRIYAIYSDVDEELNIVFDDDAQELNSSDEGFFLNSNNI